MNDVLRRNNVTVLGKGKTTMIFGHGFSMSQKSWRLVAPFFMDDYRVILFDYTGSGNSDLTAFDTGRYSSLDGYASDLLEICEALDCHDTVFVGHSISGLIGLLAAIREPERFSDLIMLGTSPCFMNIGDYKGGLDPDMIATMLHNLKTDFLAWAKYMSLVAAKNEDKPELAMEILENFCSADARVLRQFAGLTFQADLRHELPRVSTPVFSIQTSDDNLVTPHAAQYLLDKIPFCTMRTMNANGHFPQLSDPDEVVDLINEYLTVR